MSEHPMPENLHTCNPLMDYNVDEIEYEIRCPECGTTVYAESSMTACEIKEWMDKRQCTWRPTPANKKEMKRFLKDMRER